MKDGIFFSIAVLVLLFVSFSSPARAGVDLGSTLSLSVATPPVVVTDAATNITMYSAQLNGSANPLFLGTQGWFQWGTSPPPPGDSTSKQGLGFGGNPVVYNGTITGLLPGTTYHYRAAAENADGRSFGSTISFTTKPFTRDSAINRVMSQVINPSPYNSTLIAFLYDPPGAESTLVSGYTVAPLDSQFVYTVPSNKWFFWIDLTGDIKYAHPTKFVYVDAVTGDVEVDDGQWWPAVTPPGDVTVQVWAGLDDRYDDSASIIFGAYTGIPELENPPSNQNKNRPRDAVNFMYYWRNPNASLSGNTCAILVGGAAQSNGETNVWQNDLDSMNAVMSTPPPGGGASMANEVQMQNNATQAQIQAMIDSAVAHGCNSIVFYYSGHGGNTGGGYMLLNGSNLSYCDLATMLNTGGSLKFKDVILDACYSGLAVPCFAGKTIPVLILTASDSTKTSAYSLWYRDLNGSTVYDNGDSITRGSSKYTRNYIACFRKLRDSLNAIPTRKQIHDWVLNVNPDSIKEKQNPQSKHYIPPISITLNINSPGHYDFLGTGVFIDFFNIGGPFNCTVTRIFEPAPGQIIPEQYNIEHLSLADYWQITTFPPATFIGQVGFEFNEELEQIPPELLLLASRESPQISNPNPLWDVYQPTQFNPGPGGGMMLAFNVNHFSEWSMALEATQITSVATDMNAKWNIVSVPMIVADPAKTTLFPTASSQAFSYNAGYVADDTLDQCSGYWVKFDSAETITFNGDQVLRDSCSVLSGWNLLGSITKPVAVSDVSTIPSGIGLSSFFGYDAGYVVADSIRPGKGYWVKAAGDAQIIFDATLSAFPRSRPVDVRALNSLTVTDADGNKQTLYFGEESEGFKTLSTELPPVPPKGVFDARFTSGAWIELHPHTADRARVYPLSVSSASYPLTVKWNVKAGSEGYELSGIKKLKGSGSVKVDASTPLVLTVQNGSVPKEFALAQNYPNPFNPNTQIRYELPAEAYVTLKIYNILGKEVATIIDEQKPAGSYMVDVKSDNLASGVYFYKLQAGTFTGVKKMVLMK